jgi:hypothetical protein
LFLLTDLTLKPPQILETDWSGESFVHSMCGPYLQGCGNKLGILVRSANGGGDLAC